MIFLEIVWNCQLFADAPSLFSVVNNIHTKATTLSRDVPMEYDFQPWFNRRKIKKLLHLTLLFSNIPLSNSLFQKHLGLTLDIQLNFSEHVKSITKKLVIQWVSYKNFSKFCQGHLISLYKKLL